MKKWVAFLLVIVIVSLFITREKISSKPVDVFVVSKETVTSRVSASGKTAAREDIDLKFELSGKVTWVGVKEGDFVNKYQAIASIGSESLNSDLASAESLYRKALSSYTETLETYKVEEPTNIIKEKIKQAKDNVDYYKILLDAKADALGKKTILSPIEGKIVLLNVEPGETVIAFTSVVARIVNLNTYYFSTEISDADIKKIKLDQQAVITFDTTPEEYKGKVTRISDIASTNSGGETIFVIDIYFEKSNELPIGLKGDAEIVLNTYPDVMCIDTDSIFTEKDKYYVFVVEKGKAFKKEIPMPNELDSCTIVDNLNLDAMVVITPKDVTNGMKVKPNII